MGLGSTSVLLIPNRVVAEDQAGKYALVVNKDNVVEQKRIKTGQLLVGGLRVITDGLAADDRVVLTTNGQAVPGGKVVPSWRPSRLRRPAPTSRRPSRRRSAPMISAFFINRPVLANVLAIVIVILGAVALITLPVAQYPNIVPPTVQVTTTYPGANAETVVDNVALPIELQVNGVEGMIYMQSYSTDAGTYTLTVTFAIGTNLDFAQVLVQNKVSAALASLPMPVQAQGVIVQKKSTSILQIVSLTSPNSTFDSLYMANYATINLVNELSRLPGVGNTQVLGIGEYSMRVWLDPQKLYTYGLTPSEVSKTIQEQSQPVTAGQVGAPPAPKGQDFQYTVDIQGRLSTPEEFGNIVVKTEQGNGGRILRLKDIGRVELGAQTYTMTSKLNGRPNAGIAIYQLPEANALDVAKRVNAKMAELAKAFPKGLIYEVPFDTTRFVNASIHEVFMTLIEAGVLVLIVILLFLQDWRAMLVPATTVPVTIIGAFAAMAALGFTVNTTTLFGLVLAIGIVVDDAIVIVEGVAHHIERGMTPHDATIKAMGEVFGPVIGITLVLMSVFLPTAFLRGITGQMFGQFALTIAATAFISAINAVTLKPAQCALWLRPTVPPEKRNVFFRGFNKVYGKLEDGYAWLIGQLVQSQRPHDARRFRRRGPRRLGRGAPADRLHPERGPGLHAGRPATARRRLAGAHRRGDGRGQHDRHGDAGRRQGRGARRLLGARQQLHAGQRRRRLRHPQGLGRAPQGAEPGPAFDRRAHRPRLRTLQDGLGLPAGAARDPGRRQCRRLRRSRSSRRTAASTRRAAERHGQRSERQRPVGAANLVPPSAPACRRSGSTSTARRPRR